MADAGHPLAADQSSYDLSQRYFGVNPVAWLSDLYNACDAIVMDCMDHLERTLTKEVQLQVAIGNADFGAKRRGKGAAAGAAGKVGALDPGLVEQIQAGVDTLTKALLESHELPGDQFDLWAFRNVFSIPKRLEGEVSATLAPRSKPARAYTQDDEDAADGRIAELEAAIVAERRRRRALLHVRGQYERRLPSAEAAVKELHAIAAVLQAATLPPAAASSSSSSSSSAAAASSAPSEHSLPQFMDAALRLRELVATLQEAAPAALAAAPASGDSAAAGGGGKGAGASSSSARDGGLLAQYERDAAALAANAAAISAVGNVRSHNVLARAKEALNAAAGGRAAGAAGGAAASSDAASGSSRGGGDSSSSSSASAEGAATAAGKGAPATPAAATRAAAGSSRRRSGR